MFAFGTWLRENKDLELFNREEAQDEAEENDEQRSTSSCRDDGFSPDDDRGGEDKDNMEWND